MLLRYHGHAEFLVEMASGTRILTDPFPREVPWPYHEAQADVVTSSHDHYDHNHFEKVQGKPVIVRDLGEHKPAPGLKITGYPSFHDDAQGAKRGKNTIFVMAFEGLRLAHLGDLGALPAADVLHALIGVDILLLPVGGTYTIDAQQAANLVQTLRPRIVIPMHYKQGNHGFPNIDSSDAFLGALAPLTPSHQPLLRVTKEDISEAPGLVVLEAGQA